MPDIENLISYVEKYQPGFSTTLRGATEAEIARLAKFSPQPLPAFYQSYLRRMGQEYRDFNLSVDSTSKIEDLLEFYEVEYAADPEDDWFPANCFLIGLGGVEPDTCLEFLPAKPPRVVFTEGNEILGLYAATLENLVFITAFQVYRVKAFEHSYFLTSSYHSIGSRRVLTEASNLARALGFERLWFSDAITFCGEQPHASISLTQFEGKHGLAVMIRAHEREYAEQLAQMFSKELPGLSL